MQSPILPSYIPLLSSYTLHFLLQDILRNAELVSSLRRHAAGEVAAALGSVARAESACAIASNLVLLSDAIGAGDGGKAASAVVQVSCRCYSRRC